MKNRIDVRVEFSFKGEVFSPSATINLDAMVENDGGLTGIYALLARENNIDTYSYLYEVMQASDLRFNNPVGLAESCFIDGSFDLSKFKQFSNQETILAILRPIAKKYLDIDDLDQQPGLKSALIESYNAGKR